MKDIKNTVAKVLEIEATYAKAQQSEDYQIINGLIQSAIMDEIDKRAGDHYAYAGWYVMNGKFYGRLDDLHVSYTESIEVDVNKVNASQGDGWKLITADDDDEEYARQETLSGQCPDIPYE